MLTISLTRHRHPSARHFPAAPTATRPAQRVPLATTAPLAPHHAPVNATASHARATELSWTAVALAVATVTIQILAVRRLRQMTSTGIRVHEEMDWWCDDDYDKPNCFFFF